MAGTHFVQLARLEETGLVTVCRHGIVHFSWHNVTVRLRTDTFQRLGALLEKGQTLMSPIPICDEELCVGIEESDYRVSVGIVELLLTPQEFLTFVRLVQQALQRLEEVVNENAWNEPQPKPMRFAALETIFPPSFSPN